MDITTKNLVDQVFVIIKNTTCNTDVIIEILSLFNKWIFFNTAYDIELSIKQIIDFLNSIIFNLIIYQHKSQEIFDCLIDIFLLLLDNSINLIQYDDFIRLLRENNKKNSY